MQTELSCDSFAGHRWLAAATHSTLCLMLSTCLTTAQAITNLLVVPPGKPSLSRGVQLQPFMTNRAGARPVKILPVKPASESVSAKFLSKVSCEFRVGTAFGDRDVCNLSLRRSGHLRIEAVWQGAPDRLALILNGPGQAGYYARKDGNSPLRMDFDLKPEVLERGDEWTVSIVNFSKLGPASGILNLETPSQAYVLSGPSAAAQSGPGAPTKEEIQRTIGPDGIVKIRYPDGMIKYVRSDGYDIIYPDGSAVKSSFVQVVPATPPALPSETSIEDWLKWQNDELLDLIRRLVNEDKNQVDYYLKREMEKTSNLYEQMYSRTRLIEDLLSPP